MIKKTLVMILIIISFIDLVYANEYPEITDDVEIRYKWYKNVIVPGGKYVPKDEITSNDIINKDYNQQYDGMYSNPCIEHCKLSPEYYQITRKLYTTYKKVPNASHVLVENINYDNNIKIYYDNKEIDFNIISIEEKSIKIDLKGKYLNEKLMFYVDSTENYKISLYVNSFFLGHILSKSINNEKISIPDKTWITDKTPYETIKTDSVYANSDLTTILYQEEECRFRDILVYRENTEKQYYDNEYHTYVEGYLKDTNDYKFYYKGEPIKEEPIIKTIEVIREKIIKEPQIEYVYIKTNNKTNKPQIEYVYVEKENNLNENKNDSSNSETKCHPEIITETKIKKEIVEREILKIPKIMYVIGFIMTTIIIILIIKVRKKNVV